MAKDTRTQQQRLHDLAKAGGKPQPKPTPRPTVKEILFGRKK